MMQHMGPGMMGGMEASPLFWLVLITVLALLLLGACTWLVVQWLKNQMRARIKASPQPLDEYSDYAQGYRPPQLVEMGTSQEGGQRYSSPQPHYEQPQAQYHR